jgi:serine/threonine-protein kinase
MDETVLFGRYRLLEPAGRGGSAQVWRALDTETGDEVAVKRLHPIVFADDAGRRRLEREFRALESLDEPHIVRVRDLRLDADDGALILDFVSGPSLAERLAEGQPIDPAAAVSIARDIAAALAAAHAAGIVHRDVTPGNILLEPGDGARLTDFGIALGGVDATATVTAAGQLVGTLRYLAPEQLRGEPATPASDLHSLAAVTYEMLAGRPAYAAATPVALAEGQSRGPARIEGVSRALDEAVRRGLAANPAERQADVTAFADELLAAIEDARTVVMALPVFVPSPVAVAEEVPVVAATPAPPRRRRLPTPVMAVVAVVLGGLILAALVPGGDDPTAEARRVFPAPTPAATRHVTPEPTVTPTATPTATPTPTPTPKAADGKGEKGNGNGKGKGD